MRTLLLDGYTDEPACLGVPPYISPHVRLAYGSLSAAGSEAAYATIDQWRAGGVDPGRYDLLAVVRHVAVPGKYLRGMPASDRELEELARGFRGPKVLSLGVAPDRGSRGVLDAYDIVARGDMDAGLFDLVVDGDYTDRLRTAEEWRAWSTGGAAVCAGHPDHGGPLIAEVQMYRGCVRHISGGCRFCTEPLLGDVLFRPPKDILEEVRALASSGVRHLRLGAQSCVFSYMASGVGETETPTPNPEVVESLFSAIVRTASPDVFHLDNANPAVIAAHPEESRKVLGSIVAHCTSGNVLAMGLESADPEVAAANNLNADPETALAAVRLVNEVGGGRGPTGLPAVLPGLNFLCGLDGERKETYQANMEFLRQVLRDGLLLRRTNIRQVIPSRRDFPGVRHRREFERFRRAVRQEIDLPMLRRVVPEGTVLRRVYTELVEGGRTFGRQVGTYPLLVGLPYRYEAGRWVDVAVTGTGPKSVVGIVHPTRVNSASMSMLEAVPGIGRRRAMAIVRGRPFGDGEELWSLFDGQALPSARFHLSLDDVDRR
jgi:radical SAM superfamily enzyme with C-terminal helix-hairpin-helix motif